MASEMWGRGLKRSAPAGIRAARRKGRLLVVIGAGALLVACVAARIAFAGGPGQLVADVKWTTTYYPNNDTILIQSFVVDGHKRSNGWMGAYKGSHVRVDCLRGCIDHDYWDTPADWASVPSANFEGLVVPVGAQIRVTITQDGSFGFYDLLTAVARPHKPFVSKRACLWLEGGSLNPISCNAAWNHFDNNPSGGRYCGQLPDGGSICLRVSWDYNPKLTIDAVVGAPKCGDGTADFPFHVVGIPASFGPGHNFHADAYLNQDADGAPTNSTWHISGFMNKQGQVEGTVSMSENGSGEICRLAQTNFTAKYKFP
jgi:hypothetical protein